MKKILSVALSTAMAFSMFASVAFGDTAVTPQAKFDALKAKGIFTGYPDGSAHLEKEMTRAEFAKVITKVLGLKEVTGVLSYKDKGYTAKNWAVPYIEAVSAAGIMQGKNVTKKIFDFNGKVTVEEMATVLTRALELEVPTTVDNSASTWAKGYVQAAINAGLVAKTANFQSNATRSLLVESAFAVDEIKSVPTVASYVVSEGGKVVEFTLSNKEVVKVTLDKALEANKETEVKFTSKDKKEYTHKVTYVTTVASKVQSATAANLKEVVVTFDGTVEAASAENKNNYVVDGKSIDSVTLSADKKVATVLLAENNTLTTQKETYIQVNNLKNEDSTKTITQKVNFTPLDVTIPEVKEVTALGTKALKIVFSEPVQQTDLISSNFRIDDKTIAANVEYAYPNTVIVTTNLTEGEHTLRASGVRDFSGLSVVPVEKKFTATVDTTAPKSVSAKSYDLKQVTVEFDEPVKSVSGAYANASSFTASKITVKGNKVVLDFASTLNYADNTITLSGVRDYSGNSGSVDVKVTPTLDTVRPTVVTSKFYQDNTRGNNYVAEIQLSKAITSASAKDRSNFILKNSNGTVVNVGGVNSNGNPIQEPVLSSDGKTIFVLLGTNLKEDTYTLSVQGLRDTTVAGNVILPYTANLSSNDAQNGVINRSWSQGQFVYIQFNKTLSTSGAGNAQEAAKYTIDGVNLTKSDSEVTLQSTDTVRILASNYSGTLNGKTVKASYIAGSNGEYLRDSQGRYELLSVINDSNKAISVTGSVYANSTSKVELNFNGPLSTVNASEFVLKNADNTTLATAGDYTLSNNNKTLTLDFDKKVPATFADNFKVVAKTYTTKDSFGNTLDLSVDVFNAIKPEFDTFGPVTSTSIEVKLTKDVTIANGALAANLFKVKVGDTDVIPTGVTLGADSKTLIIAIPTTDTAGKQVYVKFDGSGNASKIIVDTNSNKNPLDGFEKYKN